MVNVYGLSVSVREEEIHYLSPPLPTTTIIATITIVDIFGLSFYCKENHKRIEKKQKGEKTQKNIKQKKRTKRTKKKPKAKIRARKQDFKKKK